MVHPLNKFKKGKFLHNPLYTFNKTQKKSYSICAKKFTILNLFNMYNKTNIKVKNTIKTLKSSLQAIYFAVLKDFYV